MRSPISRPAVLSAAVLLSACGSNVDTGTPTATTMLAGSSAQQAQVVADAGRSAAGSAHTLGLDVDGGVYAWGSNAYGQLGTSSVVQSPVPVAVSGLTRIKGVDAGSYHSVAVKSDGSVWTWGNNSYGQLGQGRLDNVVSQPRQIPVTVGGLSNVKTASAGHTHTVALATNGTVWGWGTAASFRSGTPVQIKGLSGVKTLVAGHNFNLAIQADNTLWGWGGNAFGQVGIGKRSTTVAEPTRVQGIDGVVGVAAGYLHALALRQDGSVWAWGSNDYKQVGTSGTTYTPRQVSGLPTPAQGAAGVKAIAAGLYNSAVLYADGTVWIWGNNSNGQLGNSGPTASATPVRLNTVSDIVALSVGDGFVSLIDAQGKVFGIGANDNGQLGNNTTSKATVPVQVVGLSGVSYLKLGKSAAK